MARPENTGIIHWARGRFMAAGLWPISTEDVVAVHYLCVQHKSDEAVQDTTKPVCFVVYYDVEPPPFIPENPQPPEGPRPEPWVHIQALGTILQAISSLSERAPMRRELYDMARGALETAVAELGDGAELVTREAVSAKAQ